MTRFPLSGLWRLAPTTNSKRMVRVGNVRTFDNFVVPVPATIDPTAYNSVTVWREPFGQFITAAQCR